MRHKITKWEILDCNCKLIWRKNANIHFSSEECYEFAYKRSRDSIWFGWRNKSWWYNYIQINLIWHRKSTWTISQKNRGVWKMFEKVWYETALKFGIHYFNLIWRKRITNTQKNKHFWQITYIWRYKSLILILQKIDNSKYLHL